MPEKASSFTKQINILYCKTHCFLTSVTVKNGLPGKPLSAEFFICTFFTVEKPG